MHILVVMPADEYDTPISESKRTAFNARLATVLTDLSGIFGASALIGVDILDMRTALFDRGPALIGIGQMRGEHRAIFAAKKALADLSAQGLKANMIAAAVLAVATPPSMELQEVADVMNVIHASTSVGTNIVSGAYIDRGLTDELRVCLLANAIESSA